jgi:CelD/BcsL family acetyltransferase involved in cellulose biosynthesis
VAVEVLDGDQWDAARWPSNAADPALEMTVFQTREFLESWMRTIGRDRGARPYLAVAVDGSGRPVLYLPLAIETRFGLTFLRFMDAGVADLNAPVVNRERELTAGEFAAIWKDTIAQLPSIDVIDLRKMPDHLNGVHNPLTYLACDSDHGSGFLVSLSNLPEVHARGSIVRMHKKLRRQLQRLTERGRVDFTSNPQGGAMQRIIDGLLDLKRMQYLRTWGRDFLEMPGVKEFYRDMAGPGRLGRISDLSALTLDDNLVSAHLGFTLRSRFYYVMPAYDTQYRSLAPGYLLLDHLMRRFRDDGYDVFDLGEGAHAYKAQVGDRAHCATRPSTGADARGHALPAGQPDPAAPRYQASRICHAGWIGGTPLEHGRARSIRRSITSRRSHRRGGRHTWGAARRGRGLRVRRSPARRRREVVVGDDRRQGEPGACEARSDEDDAEGRSGAAGDLHLRRRACDVMPGRRCHPGRSRHARHLLYLCGWLRRFQPEWRARECRRCHLVARARP